MKIIKFINQIAKYLSMITVVLMMLLIVADVIMRFVFSRPVSGAGEITEVMMVWIILAAGYCALEGSHVKVDLIISKFSRKVQGWFDIMTLLLSLGIYCVIVSQGLKQIKYAYTYDIKSTILEIPQAFELGVFTVTFSILCLAILSLIIRRITEVFGK